MQRIVTDDLPLIEQVSGHLLQMRGKMFRPTLALLASDVDGHARSRASSTLAAVVELMHLATLVHDDSVDHSVLRRGLPTVNSLFSHQVSRDHGRLPLLARARRRSSRMGDLELCAIAHRRGERADDRRDAAARRGRRARVHAKTTTTR